MKYTFLILAALLSVGSIGLSRAQSSVRQIYELRVYELTMGSLGHLENYLGKALIPALNRNGVPHVGVFREAGQNEPPKIYVLIPYRVICRLFKSQGSPRPGRGVSQGQRNLPQPA